MSNIASASLPEPVDVMLFFHLEVLTLSANQIIQGDEITTLALIILKHLIDFSLIITGDAIRENSNTVTRLTHIEAGGFYASNRIRPGNIEIGNLVLLYLSTEKWSTDSVEKWSTM